MTRAGLRMLSLAAAAAVSLAACNQSDSGNVMAPGGNSLTPAQVDAALGPDPESKSSITAGGAGNASAAEGEANLINSSEEEQP